MNDKIPLKEAIIVEGRYDKAKVSRLFDTVIIETNGFSIFNDKEKTKLIKTMAQTIGIIILTDSDSAGFMIRNYIKNILSSENVKIKHAYIPDMHGKEHRKNAPSAEGKLGVEGIPDNIIIEAVKNAGAENLSQDCNFKKIDKAVLYEDGLIGQNESSNKRKQLLAYLNLPEHLSSNSLCGILNSIVSYDEYKKMVTALFKSEQ